MRNNKRLVIVTSQLNEAITESLAKMTDVTDLIITLADFLQSITVCDEIDCDRTKIQWQKGTLTIRNDDNTLVLSRLFYMPLDLFDDFSSDDKDYAAAEIRAYLGFALHSFNTLNNALDENGHEILHPLPTQWELIKKYNTECVSPSYYWGDSRFNHLQGPELVYSDICNFKKWRPSAAPDENIIFCFERPVGNPYFSLVINGAALITTDHQEVDPTIITNIANQSIMLAKQFNYVISESLYFYDGHQLTLAFISPFIIYSKKNSQFDFFVHKQFRKVLQ